ncbi:MAG: HDOD domain-containing protein [Methylophaga sp.]|nr:HDOD domain-containing protein [Methylophaga sp.]
MSLTPIALVERTPELASPPTVYNKLSSMLNDENSSAEHISAVINTDPALATRLLKIVNSAFYGFPSQIATISRAITIIGTTELTNLVLATSVINSFKDIPDSLININEFWHQSLSCAIASMYIAKQCGQRATERFFILGLLHNIGSLVLYQTLPELSKQVLMAARFDNEPVHQAEKRIIGFDHCEVGLALSQAWRLPPSIGEVIRYHLSPSEAESFPTETAIIHLANIVVGIARQGDDATVSIEPEAWDLLQLNTDVLPEIIHQMNEQLENITSVMLDS